MTFFSLLCNDHTTGAVKDRLGDMMQSLASCTVTKDRLDLGHLGGKDIGSIGSKSTHDAFRLACPCVPKSPVAP